MLEMKEDMVVKRPRHITTIHDKREDDVIIDDIISDINMILEYRSKRVEGKATTADLKAMIKTARCKNTIHSLQVLKKVLEVYPDVSPNFAAAVALHDVTKWKNRSAIVNLLFRRYFTYKTWVSTGDHGFDSGYFLNMLFQGEPFNDFSFVFIHTKNRPYYIDDTKWDEWEIAFFIFDDLVRDPKKYKTKLPKSQYAIVQHYYEKPRAGMTPRVFEILKNVNTKKK